MPSDVPSLEPSSQPSSQPSSMPSDVPSMEPSSQPSSQPSSMPSDMPSLQPSSQPSDVPSSEPSSTPSCTPSASPTEAPSRQDNIVFLFYPEWTGTSDGDGCRNDGEEEDYMAVNPSQWLSSTMEACCNKFFSGYQFDSCMGRFPKNDDDCILKLYYPDWSGSNEGCIADGKEPYYMLSNHGYFLSSTLEECCQNFYQWDYFSCLGTTPTLTNGEYYPNWSGGGSNTCVKDGNVPEYMFYDQSWYLSPTLQKCCEKHYHWNLHECLGSLFVGTEKWYPEWGTDTCVQDCEGASPCGGAAESWNDLYSSRDQCCTMRFSWNKEVCMGSAAVDVGSAQWYVSWGSHTCVQDCVGASPCGGLAENWDQLFSSKSNCCDEKLPWVAKCETL
mmetsp:Transcript_14874/g.24355  ORF Transcript_14874/g.24355 Transcript_14874/m.24355 type:complete len:387 (+) Transcript_14874:3-1163(+)